MMSGLRAPKSIAGRLLLFSGIFVTAALAVASIVLWFALKNVVREQIDQRLDTQINALASAAQALPDGKISLSTPMDAPPFDRAGSGWYWQIEANGHHLTSRSLMQNPIDTPPPRQNWKHMLSGTAMPGEGEDQTGKSLYTRQITRAINGTMVTITATAPAAALSEPAVRALIWLIPSMLLLGVVLLGGTLWQIRFGLRPLVSMANDIDAINRGELRRLSLQKSPELLPLSDKINALLDTNEDRLIATRMQFANLAHGLKTPVASLLVALNDRNDPDGSLRDLSQRIDYRIKHHLGATRQAMTPGVNFAGANIATTVNDLHLAISSIHAEKNIRFDADIGEDLEVACDSNDLEEMLGNLMENAFKWATSRVGVSAQKNGASFVITISDDGPGIPPDRIHAVRLPGVREDERVVGTGFGLTIVDEMAELYGGSLELAASSPKGLKAILTLPASVRPRS